MHIHKNPLLLGTLPAALEVVLDVFIPAVMSQGKADPAEDCLGVSGNNSTRKCYYLEEFPASTHTTL
jgi:hypothetical protein